MLKYSLTARNQARMHLVAIYLLERGIDLFNCTATQLDKIIPDIITVFPDFEGQNGKSLLVVSSLYNVILN